MNKVTNKILIIGAIVLGLIFVVIGATFAYLTSNGANNNTTINGATYKFSVGIDVSPIRNGNLIPVADNLIISTLNSNHVCEDTRGYGLCTIHRVRFTNNGNAQVMTGNLKTVSSTYTTNNLKYQLFTLSGNTYSAITTAAAINNTANALNYLRLNNTDITVSMADGTASSTTVDMYLVLWLSDTGSNQLDDQNKSFSGQLSFVSAYGDTLTSTFINS